jgi:hypothetical protein
MQRSTNSRHDRQRRELPPSELGGRLRWCRAFVPARRRLPLQGQRVPTTDPHTARLPKLRHDPEDHAALASAPDNHEAAAVAA